MHMQVTADAASRFARGGLAETAFVALLKTWAGVQKIDRLIEKMSKGRTALTTADGLRGKHKMLTVV